MEGTLCGHKPARSGYKYCSLQCQQDYTQDKYIKEWLAGKQTGGTQHKVSGYVRRYLISLKGERCWRCSWSEKNPVTEKCPLEVDHVNGDSTDHRPENLALVCPNCHSLTPTYRNLNKGKGRKYRRATLAQM